MQPMMEGPVSLDGSMFGRSPEAEAVDISTSDDEAAVGRRAHSGSQTAYRASSYAQRESSDTDTDEDGVLIKRARTAMQQQRSSGPARKRGSLTASGQPKARMGNITLKMLLDEGLVLPGENNLVSEYKGVTQLASLRPDGRIACIAKGQENVFESPSAFSIFFKRMVTPGRKADDGWKTVKFQGKFLDHYKMELARRREGEAAEPGWDALQTQKKSRADTNGSTHPASASSLKRNASWQGTSNAVVPCRAFQGRPGSLADKAQPFQLAVAPGALVALDFHSHLSAQSVCGLLAGIWDGADKVVRIHHAVPILTTVSEQNGSVSGLGSVASMDQSAVSRANRHISHNLQLSCLGFFRSHPGASAQCRADDVATIAKLQGQLRPHAAHVPFICALCDPAGASGEDATSAISFYYCPQLHAYPEGLEDGAATAAVAARPPPPDVHSLEATVLAAAQLDQELAEKGVEDLKHLAVHMSKQAHRADLMGMQPGSQDSMLNKLKGSLAVRLPDPWGMDFVGTFLSQLSNAVSAAWAPSPTGYSNGHRAGSLAASLAASPAKPLNKPIVHLPSAAPPAANPPWQQGSGHLTGTDHQLTPKGLSDSEATEDEHPPEDWAQPLQLPHHDDSLSDGTE